MIHQNEDKQKNGNERQEFGMKDKNNEISHGSARRLFNLKEMLSVLIAISQVFLWDYNHMEMEWITSKIP